MPVRSMTGFAQVQGQLDGRAGFTLSLKAVNHRFLDLHLRLPGGSDSLEMKLRRVLKEKLSRGHVELTVSLERAGEPAIGLNREFVAGLVRAFRAASQEFGLSSEPDLNAILRLPGALTGAEAGDAFLEDAVLEKLGEAIGRLNHMREEEGRGIAEDLRGRMQRLQRAAQEVGALRADVARALFDKVQSRMRELAGAAADPERLLQEAALLAERSDIQEELVRLETHVGHFLGLLESGGEAGKKLDFLLQEMNREANTLLSKTSGIAGEGLRITELGLEMKAEIEKCREQVQNVE